MVGKSVPASSVVPVKAGGIIVRQRGTHFLAGRNAYMAKDNSIHAFVEGRVQVRSALETSDLSIRKLTAIEALSRYGVAQPRMLDSISIDPNNWPTSAVLDWLNVLSRVDAIPNAGKYDGVVGVLGGLEAIRALQRSGFRPTSSYTVSAFTPAPVAIAAIVVARYPRSSMRARAVSTMRCRVSADRA